MEQRRRGIDNTVSYESQRPPRPKSVPPAAPIPAELAATTVDAQPVELAATAAGAPPASSSALALGATMAAPLPRVEGGENVARVGATTVSVLPRVEAIGEVVKLSPASGPRYRSVRTLGVGGMGEVALVEDADIGRTVAMKRLIGDERGAPFVARFVDEVRTIGSLEHPNIVPIHDVGVDENGKFFFVMKYVDGETLESVIERLQAGEARAIADYTITRRVEIFAGLVRALQYAHARGVIHRDVKPANIMIGKYGEVVLMDWGVARPLSRKDPLGPSMSETEMKKAPSRASETHLGALIGTPLYMSPEQALGKNDEVDGRSDLYAACLVFHELLGLRHLRADKASLAELIACADDDPPPVHAVFVPHPSNRNGIPPELGHFVRRGLERAPKNRWQSADEILLELEAIADGRCRIQCPHTMNKRMIRETGRLVDRAPLLALATFGFVALCAVALVANAIRDLVW